MAGHGRHRDDDITRCYHGDVSLVMAGHGRFRSDAAFADGSSGAM